MAEKVMEAVKPSTSLKNEHRFYLKQMMRIRAFEDKVFELLARDIAKGASHVYAGQEAVAVGACACIGDKDYITSTHRGHGHCIARGGDLNLMLAELCGKATGYCRGRGGSMHIADVSAGNLGATGIVGGNIPVATGAALACMMRKTDSVVLCFFGDGASNNGTFHESLNMAGLWKLPVIYICENNRYGMSVSVERACSVKDIAIRGIAYNMPGRIVDGMNLLEVKAAVAEAVARARKAQGPTLIECKTYRFVGHCGGATRHNNPDECEVWKKRDPITLLEKKLIADGHMTAADQAAMKKAVHVEVEEAVAFAKESAFPKFEEMPVVPGTEL
jgi:TPP-dependent pyruvate/acetoin dehydrogenase alpha subunit